MSAPLKSRTVYHTLPHGEKTIRFKAPQTMRMVTVDAPQALPEPEWQKRIQARLSDKHLAALLEDKVEIVVVLPGELPVAPFRAVLQALVKKIDTFRKPHARLTLLVADGTESDSAPLTRAVSEYGLPRKHKTVFHKMHSSHTIFLGKARDQVPVHLNQILFYADCIIVLDGLQLDPLAGYTGGWQSVAMGCSSTTTTHALRRAAMAMGMRDMCPGRTWNNPLQRLQRRAASTIPIHYTAQLILDSCGGLLDLYGGYYPQAYFGAVKRAGELYRCQMKQACDAALVAVPAEQGRRLATVCRVLACLGMAEHSALKPGAPILAPVTLEEEPGSRPHDRALLEWLEKGADEILKVWKNDTSQFENGCSAVIQIARLQKTHPVVLIGSAPGKKIESWGFHHARTMPDGFRAARKLIGSCEHVLFQEAPMHSLPMHLKGRRKMKDLEISADDMAANVVDAQERKNIPFSEATKEKLVQPLVASVDKPKGRMGRRPRKITKKAYGSSSDRRRDE